jgi:methyl coenzyme M reductase subunit C-like uncharacterized protein (methanogenesis marker protein 7)
LPRLVRGNGSTRRLAALRRVPSHIQHSHDLRVFRIGRLGFHDHLKRAAKKLYAIRLRGKLIDANDMTNCRQLLVGNLCRLRRAIPQIQPIRPAKALARPIYNFQRENKHAILLIVFCANAGRRLDNNRMFADWQLSGALPRIIVVCVKPSHICFSEVKC